MALLRTFLLLDRARLVRNVLRWGVLKLHQRLELPKIGRVPTRLRYSRLTRHTGPVWSTSAMSASTNRYRPPGNFRADAPSGQPAGPDPRKLVWDGYKTSPSRHSWISAKWGTCTIRRAAQRPRLGRSRFWSDSPRQITRQVTSTTATLVACDTQVASNPEKDATIKQSSTSMIAAVSQAKWISCRRIFGSDVGSGF
jgi:hypothetical protein